MQQCRYPLSIRSKERLIKHHLSLYSLNREFIFLRMPSLSRSSKNFVPTAIDIPSRHNTRRSPWQRMKWARSGVTYLYQISKVRSIVSFSPINRLRWTKGYLVSKPLYDWPVYSKGTFNIKWGTLQGYTCLQRLRIIILTHSISLPEPIEKRKIATSAARDKIAQNAALHSCIKTSFW